MPPVLLANKYMLLKRIAAGGMAEIFLAKQIGIDGFEKLVVVKRVLPELANQPEYVRMFLDEARASADLRHPNIVSTVEIGEDQGAYFIVMEYLHGIDLRGVFRALMSRKETFPLPIAIGIVMEACAGLHYAHKKTDLKGRSLGIIHRDISPQNLVLTFDGEAKIVDFGIAQGAHLKERDPKGILKGKFGYMSPEQARGDELDQRTDQFSLAVVLYELTTSQRLFKRANIKSEEEALALTEACVVPPPSQVARDYPPALETIVMRALSKDREQRFEDCEAFRQALSHFLQLQKANYSRDRISAFMRARFRDDEDWRTETACYSYEPQIPKSSLKLPAMIAGVACLALAAGAALFFYAQAAEEVVVATTIPPGPLLQKGNEEPQSIGTPEQFAEVKPVAPKAEKKKIGRLKIVVEPWGEIEIDGKKVGMTPIAPQKIVEGAHTVRIKNPRLGADKTLRVIVRANQDTLVRHNFEAKS